MSDNTNQSSDISLPASKAGPQTSEEENSQANKPGDTVEGVTRQSDSGDAPAGNEVTEDGGPTPKEGRETVAAGPLSGSAKPKDSEQVEKPYVPQKDQPQAQALTEKVVKGTFTKNELLRRIRLLNDFLSYRLFSPEGIATKELHEQIKQFFELHRENIGELDILAQEADWLNSLSESFFEKFTKENFNTVFESLEKELVATVPLILYLPFYMPDAQQKEIGTWLKTNVSPAMLFETNFDPSLIGGCAFSYKGVLRDFSIHALIDTNKQTIIDHLKTFKKG